MANMRLYKFYIMFNHLILLELQVEKNLKEVWFQNTIVLKFIMRRANSQSGKLQSIA